ncbi:hypothetical protein ACN077_05390 [Clostridium chromiireducens]|uniref:hypothetical protein n=1 Tax=Clostridium chromiireducens TaxID=225345 RepID=UPI003AF9DD92
MSGGWFKIHRCLFDKAIWIKSTLEQKVILVTLLSMANHEEKEWEWGGKKFTAKPGELVTSLESIVKKSGIGISVQNVRTALKRFEKYEFLTQEVTKTGRFIKIINWGVYQGSVEKTNKEADRGLTNIPQTSNKDLTTNKNEKNYKNDKNKIYIGEFTQNDCLKESIMDFMKMREKIRKPMTHKALAIMLSKLKAFSQDEKIQIRILENSIEHCWKGIYPLKEESYGECYGQNYAKSERKFNIKIPEWRPRANTHFERDEPM